MLPKPFFVLAPMDDVTDTVFRQIVAGCAPPDLYFTEFVNVDGLQSPGRPKLMRKLVIGPYEGASRVSHVDGVPGDNENRANGTKGTVSETRKQSTQQSAASTSRIANTVSKQAGAVRKAVPIIAQIWGKNPENYYKTTKELIEMGFAGVDINMGCPVKAVVKQGCCSVLIDDRGLAGEIVDAVKKAAGDFPVSVKTRLGTKEVDLSWIEFLLQQKLNMLTIHGRTAKQMSKVPADWDTIGKIREMRDSLSPTTLIVGNGDVMSRSRGVELAEKYGLDGIMIGRGVFHDPFVFADKSPWANYSEQQRKDLYTKHVKLFQQTYEDSFSTDLPEVSRLDGVQGDNENRAYRTNGTESETRRKATKQSAESNSRVSGSAAKQAVAVRNIRTLNKFCKVYIEGFPGAKELREKLMSADSTDELLTLLK